MKKAFKRIVSIILLIVSLLSVSTNAHAANVCSNISGNTKTVTAFSVATEFRLLFSDKITLTQTHGTMAAGLSFLSDKIFWKYQVKVEKLMDSGSVTKYLSWGYTKDLTIKLDKGVRYRITVTPVSDSEVLIHYGLRKLSSEITSLPTWRVSSTSGISSCAKLNTANR